MDKADWGAFVRSEMPSAISPQSAAMAIDFYYDNDLCQEKKGSIRAARRACIVLATLFDRRVALAAGQSTFFMPLTPEDRMTSTEMAEKIRPAVEQVRRELFGRPDPPFAGLEAAAQWLEQTAAEQAAQARAQQQAPAALKQTIHDLLAKYRELTGETADNPFKRELLEYVKPGNEWVRQLPVWGRTSLATLHNTSKRLADATGFWQARVVAYILVGIPPQSASRSVTTVCGYSNEFHILRTSTTITLSSPYVSAPQWRQLRKAIQKAWRIERKQPLTKQDQFFLALIHRHGGVPTAKGKGQYKIFYETIQQEFNAWAVAQGKQKTLSTWKVTWLKHQRLLKKTPQLPS
jgi:hypothetical protein